MPQSAGLVTDDGIQHYHRGKLSTAENVVTNGPLLINLCLQHTFINTLITSADQNQVAPLRKQVHSVLIKLAPLRRQVDHGWSRLVPGLCSADRFTKGPRLHQHSSTTAERLVIHGTVLVVGEV